MRTNDLADLTFSNWRQLTIETKLTFPRGKPFEMYLTEFKELQTTVTFVFRRSITTQV
jgi:hypothetical protein